MLSSLNKTLRRRAEKATSKRIVLDELRRNLGRRACPVAVPGVCGIAGLVSNSSCNLDHDPHESDNGNDERGGEGHGDGDEIVESDNEGNTANSNDCDGDMDNSDGSDRDMDCVDESDNELTRSEEGDDEITDDEEMNEAPRFQNDADKEQYVIDTLREWAQLPGVLSMTKLNDLLHRLSVVFPRMPLCYNTLFHCPYNFDITHFNGGATFWYKGIQANLDQLDLRQYLEKFSKITLDIGMDGLPLVKCKLWPILGHLVGTDNDPFIIAVYRGEKDPVDANEYLEKYRTELLHLKNHGYSFEGNLYPVEIRFYILDAPGRSFVKCCVRHNGYYSCERCDVKGEYVNNRVTYLNLDGNLRTDESFKQQTNPEHHTGVSPLIQETDTGDSLNTGLVSQVILDPFHLVHGGVFKRILEFWLFHVGQWKLHVEIVDLISNVFEFIRPLCPVDFNRKPRSLKFFKSMKGTEFRRMLLYDGILAFKDLVDDNIYKHFLLLHCAIYILSSKSLIISMSDLARDLLKLFVSHSVLIYGAKFVVYNVHALIHLVDECRDGLTLDEISAWKYENKLKSIKQTLRSGLHQLQQLARRDEEQKPSVLRLTGKATHVALSLKQRILGEIVPGQQYRRLKAGSLLLKTNRADSCFKTANGDIVILSNIVRWNRKIYLVGRKFQTYENFYEYPIESSELGIFRVSDLSREKSTFRLRDVQCKCYLMPDGRHFYLCFAIVKFLASEDDPSEYIDISLAAWIIGEPDDDMNAEMYWPPKNVTNHVKLQHSFQSDWKKCDVQILRFYETYAKARNNVKNFEEDSHYETEPEVMKKRKRIQNRKFDSSSDEEIPVRKTNAVIPAPPPVTRTKVTKNVKGQGLTAKEQRKKDKDDIMEKLKAARAKMASRLAGHQRSPWKTEDFDSTLSKTPTLESPKTQITSECDVNPIMVIGTSDSLPSPIQCITLQRTPQSLGYGSPCTTPRSIQQDVDDNDSPSTPNTSQQIYSKSPVMSDSDKKRLESYKRIPLNKSFALSPKSAFVVSSSLIQSRPKTSYGRRQLFNEQESPEEQFSSIQTSKPKTSDGSRQLFSKEQACNEEQFSSNQVSKSNTSDGCHQLFNEQDNIGEQLSSVQSSLSLVETLSRKNAAKLDILIMNQSRMLKLISPCEKRLSTPPNMPNLPLESKTALETYEAFLKESDANLAAVCDYMSNFIRSSVVDPERASARSILSKMLINNVAKEMNLEGGNKKIAFRSLYLYKVFLGTLQTAFPQSDLAAAEDALRKWLKDAKCRKQMKVSSPTKSSRFKPRSPNSKSRSSCRT
ncbi:Halomucin [Frankliniella fusca]|uniref:Halomucin n=1 Tax=Frankliniella fusca TaxID=407009 RepID=A0AAE1GVM3_9NEOP|nr:Halomucin [Frankliniella fusca]